MAKGREEGRAEGIAKGRAEGMAEGMAQGKSQGKAEQNLANARKMKSLGVDSDIISEVTGLSKEEIETLK